MQEGIMETDDLECVKLPECDSEKVMKDAIEAKLITEEEKKQYMEKYRDFPSYMQCVIDSLRDKVPSAMETDDAQMIKDAKKLYQRFGVAIAKVHETREEYAKSTSYIG